MRYPKANWQISLLMLSQVPLILLSVNSFLPLTQGFFTVWFKELMRGNLYVNSYSPLPVLSILIEGGPAYLINNPIVERIQHVLLWILLCFFLHQVTSIFKRDSKSLIFASILIMTYLYYSEPHDIVAGYFELSLLAVICLLLLAHKTTKNPSPGNLLALTVILVSIPLLKQSFLVISLVSIVFLQIMIPPSIRPRFNILWVSLTTLVVTLLLIIFGASIFQSIDGTPKKPNLTRVFENVFAAPIELVGVPHFMAIAMCTILIIHKSGLMRIAIFLLVLFDSFLLVLSKSGISWHTGVLLIIFYFSLSILLFNLALAAISSRVSLRYLKLQIFLISLLFLPILRHYPSEDELIYFRLSSYEALKMWLVPIMLIYLISITTQYTAKMISRKSPNIETYRNLPWKILFLLCAVSLVFLNSLSGGVTIQSFFFFGPIFFIDIFEKLSKTLPMLTKRKVKESESYRYSLAFSFPLALFCVFQGLFQVVSQPYEWWALRHEPIQLGNNSTEVGYLPQQLKYFNLTPKEEAFYSELNKTIGAKRVSFYAAPQIGYIEGIFPNLIRGQYRCQVSWWDICPDSEVQKDIGAILENGPDLIFWIENPEFVYEGHELAFRGKLGSSELRNLKELLGNLIENGVYTEVFRESYLNYQVAEDQQSYFIVLRRVS